MDIVNFIFDPINTKYSSALHVPSLLSSFIFHPCENSISRYINCMPDVASPRSLSLFFFSPNRSRDLSIVIDDSFFTSIESGTNSRGNCVSSVSTDFEAYRLLE